MTFHGKEDNESGDKIILPASAFERLAQMMVTYPMQFELMNNAFEVPRRTQCVFLLLLLGDLLARFFFSRIFA